MFQVLIDALFPMRCAGCGVGTWPFCQACRSELVVLSPPGCRRCGMPAEEELERCTHCPPDALGSSRTPFAYRGPARRALLRLKFNGWRAVAEAMGRAMAAVNDDTEADAVTWVPLSPSRRAGRGYDQALALARVVARELELPLAATMVRVLDTPPQSSRGGAERRRAMTGAFRALGGGRAPPARVLLVDDVLTTGATAGECARVLRAAGARRVALLTAARATKEALPARCYHRDGLPTESVVARGRGDSPPVVDASRRRNDPRKGTVGS